MRRGTWARTPEALSKHARHGAITVSTLALLGVPARTAYRRSLPGGPWQRPLPGIVLLTNSEPSRRQMVEAALLYAGGQAVVTGIEACQRHGLKNVPEDLSVQILVPARRKVISSGYAIIERTTRLPDPVVRDDLPLAPLSRSVLDACRRLRAYEPVGALITEAVQRKRLHPEHLRHELERGSQRGSAIPREVLRDVISGARSVAEIDAMRVWEKTGLPPLTWNCDLFDANGRFIARPDAWCPSVGMAWEIDSYEFHFTKEGYARTIERNARYTANGIIVLQTLPRRLRSEPDAVAAELTAAHRAASSRPCPPIVTSPECPIPDVQRPE
jgi:hypothetical protein